jgi:hypothetical protein
MWRWPKLSGMMHVRSLRDELSHAMAQLARGQVQVQDLERGLAADATL